MSTPTVTKPLDKQTAERIVHLIRQKPGCFAQVVELGPPPGQQDGLYDVYWSIQGVLRSVPQFDVLQREIFDLLTTQMVGLIAPTVGSAGQITTPGHVADKVGDKGRMGTYSEESRPAPDF